MPLLALSLVLLVAGPLGAADRPNVVLVMADDLGWAQTGYYGHPILRTPHLDAMAANGLRLDRFYAGAPSCSPTRASVLTGRTNDRTGVGRVGDSINRQERTLAAAFRQAGYATAHFGKWHLNAVETPEHPLPASDPHHPGHLGFDYWLSETNQFNLDPVLSRNGERERLSGEGSDVIVTEALDYLRSALADSKPAFVVIWFASPHRPFEALTKDREVFSDLDEPSALHHAEIVAMDRAIGRLRTGLRDVGIANDTLVWFKSDNGGLPNVDYGPEHLGVHPDSTGHLRGFKKDLYEGGLRVPSIVEWPARIEPRKSQFPSSTVDIFPTLVEIAGLAPESIHPVHDGISLADVFDGEPARRERPIGFRVDHGRAWIDNDWKLVRNYIPGSVFELYNVVGDPSEEHDLIDQRPEIAERLGKELATWDVSVDRSMTGADYPEGRVLPSGRSR